MWGPKAECEAYGRLTFVKALCGRSSNIATLAEVHPYLRLLVEKQESSCRMGLTKEEGHHDIQQGLRVGGKINEGVGMEWMGVRGEHNIGPT